MLQGSSQLLPHRRECCRKAQAAESQAGADRELDFGGLKCLFHVKSFFTLFLLQETLPFGGSCPRPPGSAPDHKGGRNLKGMQSRLREIIFFDTHILHFPKFPNRLCGPHINMTKNMKICKTPYGKRQSIPWIYGSRQIQ